jgi:hypothetical protein
MKNNLFFNKHFFSLESEMEKLFMVVKNDEELIELQNKLKEMIVYFAVERKEVLLKSENIKAEMVKYYSKIQEDLEKNNQNCIPIDEYLKMIEPFVEKTLKEEINKSLNEKKKQLLC